jgi:replicative DNA helicase
MSTNNTDTLEKYGHSFQQKTISALLSDIKLLDSLSELIHKKFFESESNKWIVEEILNYYKNYRRIPTIEVFKVELSKMDNKSLMKSIVEQLKIIYDNIDATDADYIKNEFSAFCINQNLKNAIIQSVDLLKSGNYDRIKELVDSAMKIGVDSELGHDYLLDYTDRVTDENRDTVPTGFDVIDELMQGGLGPGELAVVVAPSGVGKCVGGDTIIDIEYDEIGFELTDKLIAWFKPWDKIYISDSEFMYAYQVQKLLSLGVGKTA